MCVKRYFRYLDQVQKKEILQKFAFLCCDLTYHFLCYILAVANPSPFNGTIFHTHLVAMLSSNFTVLVGEHLFLVIDNFLLKCL